MLGCERKQDPTVLLSSKMRRLLRAPVLRASSLLLLLHVFAVLSSGDGQPSQGNSSGEEVKGECACVMWGNLKGGKFAFYCCTRKTARIWRVCFPDLTDGYMILPM